MIQQALICLTIAGLAFGCGSNDDSSKPDFADTGVAMQALIVNGEDVDEIEYELQLVDCEGGESVGSPIVAVRQLEGQVLPGNLTEFADTPLDANSMHAFADLFKVVKPGCYNVTTTPLDTNGDASAECVAANKTGVEVLEGQTTEVFLINQCRGSDPGALDAVSALNREPNLDDVWFSDSKFFCGSEGEICASASDPDGDPLEFALTLGQGEPCTVQAGTPTASEQCWTIVCDEAGKVDFKISVYDLLHDGGDLMRVEDWLEAEGYPSESHGELNTFAYVDSGANTPCCMAPDTKMDIVLLQDLSGSFGDDVQNVRDLVAPLHAAVNECVGKVNFGVASFIDKPFGDFGVAGDYSYRPVSDLSPDLPALQAAVNGLVLGNGYDESESQLTGIMHTANDGFFSWTPDATKFIIMMTDAPNHAAGDCGIACEAGPNDGDSMMDEHEDYPSYSQAGDAVNAIGAKVVYAVTPSVAGHYASVQANMGVEGSVVPLSSDSSNLVDAILTGINCNCRQ